MVLPAGSGALHPDPLKEMGIPAPFFKMAPSSFSAEM